MQSHKKLRHTRLEVGRPIVFFLELLIPGTLGKHDLCGLVEISPPVGPLVPTGTHYPEIPDSVLIEERHHLLAILQGDIGFPGRHVIGHTEEIVRFGILQERLEIIRELFQACFVRVP
jgi:hypothetical protein